MNKYITEFSEAQYNAWHCNDVKKRADEAFAKNDKELYNFITECFNSQINFKPCLKVGMGAVTGQGCSTL